MLDEGEDTGSGGGVIRRFGGNNGNSRTNLLKNSRLWGTSRGLRIDELEERDDLATAQTNALARKSASATVLVGTPTKTVKFMLGRKESETVLLSSVGEAGNGTVSGGTGATTGSTSATGAAGGAESRENIRGEAGGREEAKYPQAAVMNVTVQTRLWAEYFNNTLRCWEALLDPFR